MPCLLFTQTVVSLACLAMHSLLPECHCAAIATALLCVAVGGCVLTLYDFVLRSHYILDADELCVACCPAVWARLRHVNGPPPPPPHRAPCLLEQLRAIQAADQAQSQPR